MHELHAHVQERILVDLVVKFVLSFGAVPVGNAETMVRLATQPHEPATCQIHLEQTQGPLIVRISREVAWVGDGLRATGDSPVHVLGLMVGTTFEREPFGAVP